MERWTPWDPAPVPPGRYEMVEAAYDNVYLETGRALLTLVFSDGERGVRVRYPTGWDMQALRLCRTPARPAPGNGARLRGALACTAEDSDYLAWMLDENSGTGLAEDCSHHVFCGVNDTADVLALRPPALEPAGPPPAGWPTAPAESPGLAPAPRPARPPANVWRAWAPAPFPRDHYELLGMKWRGGRLDIVLESLNTRIAISHASALAMRTCDEMMRLKPRAGDEAGPAILFYRVEDSDFSAWAGAGLLDEGGRSAVHYAYFAYNDIIDVLAFDPPSISVSPVPPEEARG